MVRQAREQDARECVRVHYANTIRKPCQTREEDAGSVHRYFKTRMSKQSQDAM